MKYIKLYESYKGITFKQWLKDHPQSKGVKEIICSYSNLIDLDGIDEFKELEILYCHNNQLIELPELPESLKELYCFNNQLPYNNLKEYKIWYRKTYPNLYKAKKYNI